MTRRYLLKNIEIINAQTTSTSHLRVIDSRIHDIGPDLVPTPNELVLECSGQLACPGLINSHDHLQFNLFPRIGEPPYNNANEWGNDLHRRWGATIRTIHQIPFRMRLLWGAWKNLFSGVTLVVHHDHFSRHFRFLFPVDVLRRYTFAHSVYGEPNLERALARRKQGVPFLIHLAEGNDVFAASEVSRLMKLGGLDSRTVAAHAIDVSQADIALLEQTKTSVIWCPSSNMFLFGRTAPVPWLLGKLPVALGTDSTLTGGATLFEEMRSAQAAYPLSAREIFELVTESPRKIFGLPEDVGVLRSGGRADVFLLRSTSSDHYETILHASPGDISLMMKGGRVVFFDDTRFPSLLNGSSASSLLLDGRRKIIRDRRWAQLYNDLRPFLGHYSYLNPQ